MLGEYNLLEVDNQIILPIQTEFRLLVISSDLKFKTIIIGSDRGDLTLSIITLLTVRSPI